MGWLSVLFPHSTYLMHVSLTYIILKMFGTLVLIIGGLHVHVSYQNGILSVFHEAFSQMPCLALLGSLVIFGML